jgi:hypothetical protein
MHAGIPDWGRRSAKRREEVKSREDICFYISFDGFHPIASLPRFAVAIVAVTSQRRMKGRCVLVQTEKQDKEKKR